MSWNKILNGPAKKRKKKKIRSVGEQIEDCGENTWEYLAKHGSISEKRTGYLVFSHGSLCQQSPRIDLPVQAIAMKMNESPTAACRRHQ